MTKRYQCIGVVTGSKYLGIVEAETEDEAIAIAAKNLDVGISLCHQCAKEFSDLEVEEITVEENFDE